MGERNPTGAPTPVSQVLPGDLLDLDPQIAHQPVGEHHPPILRPLAVSNRDLHEVEVDILGRPQAKDKGQEAQRAPPAPTRPLCEPVYSAGGLTVTVTMRSVKSPPSSARPIRM